jgi:hypothetical protein
MLRQEQEYNKPDLHAITFGRFTHPAQVIGQIADQGVIFGLGQFAGLDQFKPFDDLVFLAIFGLFVRYTGAIWPCNSCMTCGMPTLSNTVLFQPVGRLSSR